MAMSMTLRRRLADWAIAGVLIAAPLLILRASSKSGGLSAMDRTVLRATSPLSRGSSWLVEGAGSLWGGYVGLVDVERENRELRAENDRLRTELGAMARRAIDADAMAELVALKQRTPADTLGARVIAAPLSPQLRVLRIRIDRGERDVAPMMPVIAAGGLVGRISEVYGDYANVALVTDPGSHIDVIVPRTGARGVVNGLGKPDSYTCQLQWLERPDAADDTVGVQAGDTVVTSGLGAAFPAGIPVGFVRSVSPHTSDMFQDVQVEPTVDMSRLRAVLVLLAPPPPPDPDAGKRKPKDPAFGTRAW